MSATMMKWTKAAVTCFYLLLIVGLALYDEKPAPELLRDLSPLLPEIIEPGNAWLVFLGFDAPQGVSPYVYGEEKLKQFRDELHAGKKLPVSLIIEDNKSGLPFKGNKPSLSSKKSDGMLAFAAANPDDVLALSRNNDELLQRYQQLYKYPRYNASLEYGFFSPIPSYSTIKKACQAKLLQLASKACRGDLEAALAGVQEDAEFWRFIARDSNTVISKLVAFAMLKTDFRFAAELGTSRQLNDKQLDTVKDILRPFDKGEVRFGKPLLGEARYGRESLKLIWVQAKPWDLITTFLFKPNATANRLYTNLQELVVRFAEMTPQQFAPELKRSDDNLGTRRMGIPFLYNPLGEIMWVRLEESNRSYLAYMARGHDLEGFRRLSLLKVLSHTQNVPAEGMQQFLDSYKADLGNPYTDSAMTWNPKKNSISFKAYQEGQPVEMFY